VLTLTALFVLAIAVFPSWGWRNPWVTSSVVADADDAPPEPSSAQSEETSLDTMENTNQNTTSEGLSDPQTDPCIMGAPSSDVPAFLESIDENEAFAHLGSALPHTLVELCDANSDDCGHCEITVYDDSKVVSLSFSDDAGSTFYYDAVSGKMIGYRSQTDIVDAQCGGVRYWPHKPCYQEVTRINLCKLVRKKNAKK